MIAVQGPRAAAVLENAGAAPATLQLGRFHHLVGPVAGTQATICRTGYTGEDGFELIVPAERADGVWAALLAAGAAPCGLGARDVLRIEAGYPLYGHELDEGVSPVEAGLMWAVRLQKGPFAGREEIARVAESGPSRRLMGLRCVERIVPRQGYTVLADNEPAGEITSGVFSPSLGRSVAMAFLRARCAKSGTDVEIAIRDKRTAARVVPKKALLHLD
jgi:aminomethyltransferase